MAAVIISGVNFFHNMGHASQPQQQNLSIHLFVAKEFVVSTQPNKHSESIPFAYGDVISQSHGSISAAT